MLATGVFDLVFVYVQFFSMLGNFGIPWPPEWARVLSLSSTLGLDLDTLRKLFPLPTDSRTEFTIVVTIVPIAFAFFSLFIFKSLTTVVWYFILLLGLALLLSAGISTAFNVKSGSNFINAGRAERSFFIYGGSFTFACIFVLVVHLCRKFKKKREIFEAAQEDLKTIIAKETAIWPRWKSAGLIFFGGGLMAAGVIGSRIIEVNYGRKVLQTAGPAFISFGALFALYGLSLISRWCRIKFWHLRKFSHVVSLKVILLLLSLVYLPVCTNLVKIFFCSNVMCNEGTRLYDDFVLTSRPKVKGCEVCNFNGSINMSNNTEYCTAELAAVLCPSVRELRYTYDNSIKCLQLAMFYWPAAILSALAFLIGVPFLFFWLVRSVTSKLVVTNNAREKRHSKSMKTYGQTNNETEKELWNSLLHKTDCVAKTLFDHYTLKYSSWKVAMTVYKLIVVVASLALTLVNVLSEGFLSIAALATIHSMAFLFVLFTQPYINKAEGRLSVTLYFMLATSSIVGCLIKIGIINPQDKKVQYILITLLALNIAVPALTFVLTLLSLRDISKKKRKKEIKGKYSPLADSSNNNANDPGPEVQVHVKNEDFAEDQIDDRGDGVRNEVGAFEESENTSISHRRRQRASPIRLIVESKTPNAEFTSTRIADTLTLLFGLDEYLPEIRLIEKAAAEVILPFETLTSITDKMGTKNSLPVFIGRWSSTITLEAPEETIFILITATEQGALFSEERVQDTLCLLFDIDENFEIVNLTESGAEVYLPLRLADAVAKGMGGRLSTTRFVGKWKSRVTVDIPQLVPGSIYIETKEDTEREFQEKGLRDNQQEIEDSRVQRVDRQEEAEMERCTLKKDHIYIVIQTDETRSQFTHDRVRDSLSLAFNLPDISYCVHVQSRWKAEAFLPIGTLNLVERVMNGKLDGKFELIHPVGRWISRITASEPEMLEEKKIEMKERKKELYKSTDVQLDLETGHILTMYFIGSGIASFLAFACCMTGILYVEKYSNIYPSDPGVGSVQFQFAGYSSWTEFKLNCCCMMHDPVTTKRLPTSTTEKWLCKNGNVKLRNREGGDSIRPFCDKQFLPSCYLKQESGVVKVICTSTTSVNW